MAITFKCLKPSTYRKASNREYYLAVKLQDYCLSSIRSISRKVLNNELLSSDQLSLLHHANNWDYESKTRKDNWYKDYTESDYEIGAYELAVDWAK